MEKKNLSKKQELAQDLGLKFDEAAELFSEETLGTMRMVSTVGGSDDDNDGTNVGCPVGYAGICVPVTIIEVKVWKCNQEDDDEEDKPTPPTPRVTPPELPTPTIVPITTAPPVLPPERPGTTK